MNRIFKRFAELLDVSGFSTSAAFNTCQSDKDELRRLTVVAAGLAATEYIYKLKNLKGA